MKTDTKLKKALAKLDGEYGLVLVTGASSGIGEAIAQAILEGTANLTVCNFSRTPSQITHPNFINLHCDISDIASMDAACENILQIRNERELGEKKTLLVNNSGFGGYGIFPEPDVAHNVDMLDVNVRGLTYMCGKLMPTLRESGGGIINVASTAAFQPCPYLNVYAASKAYVMNFSLALDWEMRKFGGHCLCLCPGPTHTNFFRRAGFDKRPTKGNFGHTSAEVAAAAIKAFSCGKKLKVVGRLNFLQSKLINFIPRGLAVSLSGRILSIFRN